LASCPSGKVQIIAATHSGRMIIKLKPPACDGSIFVIVAPCGRSEWLNRRGSNSVTKTDSERVALGVLVRAHFAANHSAVAAVKGNGESMPSSEIIPD